MLAATSEDDENVSEEQTDLCCFAETTIAQVYMAVSH